MDMNPRELDRTICLHYVGYERQKARGETPNYLRSQCQECTIDRQSAIVCPYYFNREHYEDFKKFHLK